MATCIIIPTYNERDSLPELISRIHALGLPDISILIVDDASPDGTGALADELARKHADIEVLHRDAKQGLGTAYCAGFRHALKKNVDRIVEMDADLSHQPEELPRVLDAAVNYDVVIGSRYIPGGSIRNWGWLRRNISAFGNRYARIVLGLPYHDLTSGYKCYRRNALEAIDIDKLSSIGYVFQIETTYRAVLKGCSVTEVPITFLERKTGNSKFNVSIFAESFYKVLMLRLKRRML